MLDDYRYEKTVKVNADTGLIHTTSRYLSSSYKRRQEKILKSTKKEVP